MRPQLWPAVIIVLLMLAAIFVPAWLAPNTYLHFMSMMFGPIIGGALLLVWWLAASRVPGRDRLRGLAIILLIAGGAALFAHPTMQMALIVYVLPSLATGGLVLLLLSNWRPWDTQKWIAVAGLVAGAVAWSTVRMDGIDGDFKPEFAFRWTPTAEEAFLASIEDAAPPAAPAAVSVDVDAADWPEFRGPNRDGVRAGVVFDTDWSNPPKELWRRLAGPGWSSFAVVGDYVFTQEQRGDQEAVVCLTADEGQQVWANLIPARFEEAMAGAGPRATPTFADGQLFTQGATGMVQCLDAATGDVVWQADLTEKEGLNAAAPMWGFSSSPLVVGEVVIVFAGSKPDDAGQGGGKSVVAYDRATGRLAWSAGDGTHGYSSGHMTEIAGVPQLLMMSDIGLQSFEPATGKVLWEHRWDLEGMARVVQPMVLDAQTVLIGTGFGKGTRRIEVEQNGDAWNVTEKWTSRNLKPYYNDLVYHNGHCYGFDGPIFCCIDAATGDKAWKGGRYGSGQVLLLADMGKLLVLSEKGEVVLLEATPDKRQEIARFQAIEGKTWNHPVIAGGRLFVRNGEEAACFELPVKVGVAGR